MTKDDIIRLAQEVWDTPNWNEAQTERLERFAALVAAHEREHICKQIAMLHDSLSLASAAAIRSRT